MIVWLASYPRSGNTFLRIVLHRVYGVPTYSVYEDDDPVAQRVGPGLVGYRARPADRKVMADGPEVHFVKTHKRRKTDGHPAIYLVRDGRDAVVSSARLRVRTTPASSEARHGFERLLREEITRPYLASQPSSGSWGGNVLSWLDGTAPLAVLRFEDLVADPRSARGARRELAHARPGSCGGGLHPVVRRAQWNRSGLLPAGSDTIA